MADVTVRLPPLDELARRWPQIEPLLKRATDRSAGYEPIDLLRLAMAGQSAIWVAEGDELLAAAAGRIVQHPRERILEVPFIGGTGLRLWAPALLEALEAHAKAAGCTAIMGFDRKGWSAFGFAATGVVLERRI